MLEGTPGPVTPDVARRCDEALGAGGQLVALVDHLATPPRSDRLRIPAQTSAADADQCPYRGLAAFTTEDARWFFGREQATAELIERLTESLVAGGPVTVVAPSGTGKSSLLRAGLLPALARGVLPRPGSRSWPVAVFPPTADPVWELARHLAGLLGLDASALTGDLLASVDQFVTTISAATRRPERIILVVDQFEEVFTLCPEQRRARFVEALCGLANQSLALVVLGVRADFYGHLLAYPDLVPYLLDRQVVLGPMTTHELRTAIVQPAQLLGLSLQPGLIELLVRDLVATPGATGTYEPGALPLLAHALLATWQNREGSVLTVAGYQLTGGLHAAIANSAERAYARLDPLSQDTARRVLLRLVQVGLDAGRTCGRVTLDQLRLQVPGDCLPRVLTEFIQARLLTVDTGRIEITHEALLTAWPRLRDWIEEDRSGLHAHQRLSDAAHAWHDRARSRDLLYQGAPLAVANAWAGEHPAELTQIEHEFLLRSGQEQQRGVHRLRRLVALLSVLLLLAVSATAIAWWQGNRADQQRDIAVSQRIAERADDVRAADPAVAAQLSLAAWQRADTLDARSALLSTATPYVTRLRSAADEVSTVSFSSDNSLLAVGSDNGLVELWDATNPRRQHALTTLPGLTGVVRRVAFLPHGRTLVTTSREGPQLWDVTDPAHPASIASLPGHTQEVRDVTFTADGKLLVTTGADHTARLWNVGDPKRPVHMTTFDMPGDRDRVGYVAAISPDGRTLLTGAGDGKAQLWDVATRTPLAALPGFTGDLVTAAFSPDGRMIAMSDSSNDTWVHHLGADRLPGVAHKLAGKTDLTWGLAFSPDATLLATAGKDQMVRLWDVRTQAEAGRFDQPHHAMSVAFGKAGKTLVSGGVDGNFYLWHDPVATLTRHSGPAPINSLTLSRDRGIMMTVAGSTSQLWTTSPSGEHQFLAEMPSMHDKENYGVQSPAISDDSRLAATVGLGFDIVLWDISNPRSPQLLKRWDVRNAETVAFAPGGRTLVTGDNGGNAIVWDIRNPRQPVRLVTLKDKFDDINAIDFSRNGTTMVTGDTNHGVRLWDITDPANARQLDSHTSHTEAVTDVRFTPDGKTVVSTGYDWMVRVWHIPDHHIVALNGHTGAVWQADISPDGKTVVTTSSDNTNRLWDITDPGNPQPSAVLSGGDLGPAVFTADGRTILTAGDHNFRRWDTDLAAVRARICEFAGADITQTEWTRHLGDAPYQPPCR